MAHERITFDVPEGFLPQSEPVDPAHRYSSSSVTLSRATEDDLPDIADAVMTCFPPVWWAKHEPPSIREPSYSTRLRRAAQRMRPFIALPGVHAIKASDAQTGKFMGFAAWHEPGTPIHNPFNRDAVAYYGLQAEFGWSDAQIEEMWSRMDVGAWNEEFGTYDGIRAREMGGEEHWYLAPFYVLEEYRGRGVGSLLMRYALDRADAHEPPLRCYLEALPNARPVYYRYGFEGMEGKGKGYEIVMIRPPKGKESG